MKCGARITILPGVETYCMMELGHAPTDKPNGHDQDYTGVKDPVLPAHQYRSPNEDKPKA